MIPTSPVAALAAAVALATAVPVLSQQPAAAPVRTGSEPRLGLTPMQLMSLRQVVDVTSEGQSTAWVTLEPRPPADPPGGAYLHLHGLAAPDGEPVLLAGGKDRVANVEFRPGTAFVTFVRGGKLFQVAIEGGPITPVVGAPDGIVHAHWRPDGRALAFTRLDPVSEVREASAAAGFRQRVVDEDFRHSSLWLWEEGEDPQKLTEGRTVFHMEWRPDGQALALAVAPRNLVDDSYMFQRLYLLDLERSTLSRIVANPGKLGDYTFDPDGSRLAYITGADRRDPHAGTLRVIELATGRQRQLRWDMDGMAHQLHWGEDGLVAGVSSGVETHLVRFDEDGTWTRYPTARDGRPLAGRAFAPLADGSMMMVASTPASPDELFHVGLTALETADGGGGDRLGVLEPRQLTDLNPWLADVALGRQEVVRYAARDGLEIEGMLIYPLGYEEGTRYPMVIVVHGGPEAHHSNGWLTRYSEWGQLLAARGYFAWYPNYRASTGRGVEFAKADHGDVMGGEFNDHVDAIGHFDGIGLIDKELVGIGGGSYGGYTAAWGATKGTEHFAAAVSFVPFVHIPTKWMTSDIPWEFFLVHYEEKWPWEQRDYMRDRSPLTWAPQCRTPLLLLGGDSDTRVHPSQPMMLHRAVRFATDTPIRYVVYPGEGHGNRSNVYQYDYCIRALRWFDHYLKRNPDGSDRRKARPPVLDLNHGAWIRRSKQE